MKKIGLIVLSIILFSNLILALECPTNQIDCTGQCGLYTDTNKDVICDYSNTSLAINTTNLGNITEKSKITKEYYFLEILAISILAYLFSYILSRNQYFSLVTHRKVWNILLLISFIITAITSVLIVINYNYALQVKTPFNLSFWHIEFGIVMIIISLFHTLWHIPYFRSYLK